MGKHYPSIRGHSPTVTIASAFQRFIRCFPTDKDILKIRYGASLLAVCHPLLMSYRKSCYKTAVELTSITNRLNKAFRWGFARATSSQVCADFVAGRGIRVAHKFVGCSVCYACHLVFHGRPPHTNRLHKNHYYTHNQLIIGCDFSCNKYLDTF